MNRQIAFRGKCLETRVWLYGSLLQDDYGNCVIVYFVDHHETWCDVDKETVGQFTGLYDVTGKEIYEGDVVKTNKYGKCDGDSNFSGHDCFEVIFKNGGFYLSNESREFHLIDGSNVEVYGNIY